MNYEVSAIVAHGHMVKEFHLRKRDSSALTPWEAGAHLKLDLTLPNGQQLEKHYSLVGESGACNEYRIAVLHDPNGKGGSDHLHTAVQVGDAIALSGPFNSFPVMPQTGRHVLIAGGIGITPLVSMAHALSAQGVAFELHYLARSRDRLALLDELKAIPGGTIAPYTPEDGNANPELASLIGAYSNGDALYACGPAPLLQGIRDAATANAWPDSAVHFESFGARVDATDKPLTVYLAQSDVTLEVKPGTSILDAMLAADMFVSYECKRGECANCFTPVIDGTPIHRDVCLSVPQRTIGMCTCVGWASSGRLVLDI